MNDTSIEAEIEAQEHEEKTRKKFENIMQAQVEQFHRKFAQPIGSTPHIPVRAELRAKLILEEALETAEALVGTKMAKWLLIRSAEALDGTSSKEPDLTEAVDGMCDLLYVTFGTAIEAGVDLQEFFSEIHATNMLKEGGATRADGKILKPEGWTPPRIAEMLADSDHHLARCSRCFKGYDYYISSGACPHEAVTDGPPAPPLHAAPKDSL